MLVVGFALFVVGAPRPWVAARLYGGPTEGVSRLHLRLELSVRDLGIDVPAPYRSALVEATLADGRRARWEGRVDQGYAALVLDAGKAVSGPVDVTVTTPGVERPLARGRMTEELHGWAGAARRRGGWITGSRPDGLSIRVAAGRGALAVPFEEPLLVEVRGPDGALANVELKLAAEGATVRLPPGDLVRTDARGRAVVGLAPREHAVSLSIEARAPDGTTGSFAAPLQVVPGALRVRLDGARIVVEAPTPRDVAYVELVTESERLLGAAVPLVTGRDGIAKGELPAPSPAAQPLWVVAGGEPDLLSEATVGWPLEWDPAGTPPRTFDVADALLLDGMPDAARRDAGRRRNAKALAALFSASAFTLVMIYILKSARESQQKLERHLRSQMDEDGVARIADSEAHGRGIAVAVAIACIVLGFATLALFALYRIG